MALGTPTKLPAAPRVGRNWTPRLVGILFGRMSVAFCRRSGYRLNEDMQTSKKYSIKGLFYRQLVKISYRVGCED